MEYRGTWWSDSSIELVEIDGSLYALHGWNGEEYGSCWKCVDRYTEDGADEYTLRPIYEETEPDEWEIVGYTVRQN